MTTLQRPDGKIPYETSSRETGYALVTTIWFILLGTVIVSSLMLIAIKRGQAISKQEQAVTLKLAEESVIETVAADIIFQGPRSEWASLPHQSVYEVYGIRFDVLMESEAGKIDINAADIELIERALQGLGLSSRRRQLLLERIKRKRSQNRRFISFLEWGLNPSDLSSGKCPNRYFTIASGQSRPSENFLDADLARALAIPTNAPSGRLQLGNAVTLYIKPIAGGVAHGYILRITGTGDDPFTILDINSDTNC